jgi:hypothetical protein
MQFIKPYTGQFNYNLSILPILVKTEQLLHALYIKPAVFPCLFQASPEKYLVFKSVLHTQEAEISDMYYAAQVEKLTLEKSYHNCTITKKWQCLFTNSYSLKNLISTTAEYSNSCQDGINSPVNLGDYSEL